MVVSSELMKLHIHMSMSKRVKVYSQLIDIPVSSFHLFTQLFWQSSFLIFTKYCEVWNYE